MITLIEIEIAFILTDKHLGDDIQLYGRSSSHRRRSRSPWRGPPPNAMDDNPSGQSHRNSPEYKNTCLDKRSRSPSYVGQKAQEVE